MTTFSYSYSMPGFFCLVVVQLTKVILGLLKGFSFS